MFFLVNILNNHLFPPPFFQCSAFLFFRIEENRDIFKRMVILLKIPTSYYSYGKEIPVQTLRDIDPPFDLAGFE